MLSIRKKYQVVVLAGRDRGKKGEVLRVDKENDSVWVSHIQMAKKHQRARPSEPGGIVDKEQRLPLSRVMLLCPKCKAPTRSKFGVLSDGTKTRVCRRCGEMIA